MQGTPFSFFVQWHVTERCNLRCSHCYQRGAVPEMGHAEVCRALDNVKEAIEGWTSEYEMEMAPSLHITGGEPVIRKDLFRIVDYARNLGFSVSLMSNGTLIRADIARLIRDGGVRDVQVSLDGLEPVHDAIRGPGAFRRALAGIQNLVSHDVETHINLTVSRANVDQIEPLAQLGQELGVAAVTFSRLVLCGRGGSLGGEMVTAMELAVLHKDLRKLSSGTLRVSSGDPLFSVAAMDGDVPETDFPVGGCAAGVFGVTVASDGSIMPCRRMDTSIGNIKQQSFRQLWAESPVLWALRDRRQYHGGCDSCRYWAVCRGCRAIALAQSRSLGGEDYLGPDPQCPYHRDRNTTEQ